MIKRLKQIALYILTGIAIGGAIVWRLMSGKSPVKQPTIEVKHDQKVDSTVDNIEAKYRDK